MTDDTKLTAGGTANAPSPEVTIRSDTDGHSVEWTTNGEMNSLGPYVDAKMAESVRIAKDIELSQNDKPIDEARA